MLVKIRDGAQTFQASLYTNMLSHTYTYTQSSLLDQFSTEIGTENNFVRFPQRNYYGPGDTREPNTTGSTRFDIPESLLSSHEFPLHTVILDHEYVHKSREIFTQRSRSSSSSVQGIEQALLVAPIQLTRVLGLVDSAELIVLGHEVVCQIAEEVEVGRAVAVVGGWRRRGGVYRFAVEIAVIAVGLVVAVSLTGASGWCDNRRGGSCDRRRGCRHPGRWERIGR